MFDKKWNRTVFRRLHCQICFEVVGDDPVKRIILRISRLINRLFFADKETFIREGKIPIGQKTCSQSYVQSIVEATYFQDLLSKCESVITSNRLDSKNANDFSNFHENHFNDAGEYAYREII
jgi:hypothetical protein